MIERSLIVIASLLLCTLTLDAGFTWAEITTGQQHSVLALAAPPPPPPPPSPSPPPPSSSSTTTTTTSTTTMATSPPPPPPTTTITTTTTTPPPPPPPSTPPPPVQGFLGSRQAQPATLHSLQSPTPAPTSMEPDSTTAVTFVIPPLTSSTPRPFIDDSNNADHIDLQHSTAAAAAGPSQPVTPAPVGVTSATTLGDPQQVPPQTEGSKQNTSAPAAPNSEPSLERSLERLDPGAPQMAGPVSQQDATNQGSPATSISNATSSSLEKKHQILKPKSKFKCAQSSDCHNGGLCHAGKCYCESGFTGDSCDTNIDECLQAGPEPCQNNGKCVDETNGYRCECPLGYRGEFCQDLADMCVDSPCRNNATCINQHTSYTCNCTAGWTGRHCEINIDDCAKNPCQNGATCQDLVNSYKCECATGFAGANCEVNIDDCLGNPCQNNATCHDLTNDYECECSPGFTGKNCQVNIDECANNPCGPNGECTDLVDGYNCTCHEGWRGDHCDLDVNECENRNICANNATCVNMNGGFQCKCRDGFSGKKCTDISDFCKAKQPCNFNGICKNTRSSPPFRCECFSGYLGSQCDRKRTCKPGDCNLEHSHCVSNTTCACLPGRREERTMCEYITSCEQVEGDLCLHGGTCRNLDAGGYHCTCQDPWYGPVCQFRAETQIDAILLVIITCVGFLLAACAIVSLVIFRSVRKARATRGTYSPSTQEKFGNSASDLLKPPNPERLI